mmetsp:Transcript_8174/g.17832  ORF Transcript_8174/g.17832 Transcript_8174/m.17832 type:complete len:227 (+) Transcript_8174:80-760(+)
MVFPAAQFCCGCPLKAGVHVILAVHFIASWLTLVVCGGTLIFDRNILDGSMNHAGWSTVITAFVAMWGLVFIFSAFLGILHRIEVYVRAYLYYFIFISVVDVIVVVVLTAFNLACEIDPTAKAAGCGLHRITTLVGSSAAICFQWYVVFILWSFCEEMKGVFHSGALGIAIGAKLRCKGDQALDIFDMPSEYTGYGSMTDAGIGGSAPIFGGSQPYHEVIYPPPRV